MVTWAMCVHAQIVFSDDVYPCINNSAVDRNECNNPKCGLLNCEQIVYTHTARTQHHCYYYKISKVQAF